MALCDHLTIWLNTFDGLEGLHQTPEDLSDGVAIAEVLTQIAPEWFDSDWMSKIKQDISDNHRLKLSNMKKILKGMVDYYNEVLMQDLETFTCPDVSVIAEFNNKDELGRMLQLVLGCAMNCEDKEQYIQAVMNLESDVQMTVMNCMQELMELRENSRLSADEPDYAANLRSPSFTSAEREQFNQKIHELQETVRKYREENSTLQMENERLILGGGSNRKESERGADDKMVAQMQFQMDKMKEENFALESAKDDFKLRYDLKEKEVHGLNDKIEQLSSLADEARSLKDEMDVLRHTQDKVARYEATIEAYKKKLGELGDMRQQMKTLEQKNEIYMQQTMSLEEDSKRANALKNQVELYKTQISDLHSKQMELEKRCDKAEFDAQRNKEKLLSTEAENERLKQERDMLKETNEELTLNQHNSANVLQEGGKPEGLQGLEDLSIGDSPFEMKEKLIRLEHQNKVLTLQLQEAENEKTHILQADLDIANEKVNRLETDNRQLNQEILELRGKVEDVEADKHVETQKTEAEEKAMKRKVDQHMQALQESNSELQRKKKLIDDLETQTTANSSEITSLRDQLVKKDEQMKEMEDRYKNYLDKAKSVIKTIDPKQQPAAVDGQEVSQLRDRLQEKEKLIESLERDHERMKATKEREEKLIISAWYELSMQLHRKAADERQVGTSGLSFLAKQRQAASMRRTSLTSTPRGKATA
ncbi:protein Hook homolog 3-like [Clytia hemisphaerica]|uniref:Calponin-homology (CH) domain-containing protein n=1 Tax=Clytia hemisphaerica TaxID=252671 RepID=A0A7M5UYI8_9CNID|eukprot:TCONS_00061466-protein